MPEMTWEELAQAVYRYAQSHYNDGGWDVIVETMESSEIIEKLQQAELSEMTPEAAVDSFRWIVGIWADRQADARNSAF